LDKQPFFYWHLSGDFAVLPLGQFVCHLLSYSVVSDFFSVALMWISNFLAVAINATIFGLPFLTNPL
jgi:hypothetical protein